MSRVTEAPSVTVRKKKKNWNLRLFLLFIVLPIVLLAAYTLFTLNFAYSTGQRTGYVQKISHRGWICKTWEGELAMTTFPGTAPQIFQFSVRDDATAHRIENMAGQRVSLFYDQHKGIPSSCFGETEYFVTGVRAAGP